MDVWRETGSRIPGSSTCAISTDLAKTCALHMRATLAAWKFAASNTGNGHQDSRSGLGIASQCNRGSSLQCVYRHSCSLNLNIWSTISGTLKSGSSGPE